MWVIGTGLFLNLLASVAIFSSLCNYNKMYAAMFCAAFLGTWVFALLGFIALIADRRKLGAVLITIGSLLYVPVGVGLVTIIGAIRLARAKSVHPA